MLVLHTVILSVPTSWVYIEIGIAIARGVHLPIPIGDLLPLKGFHMPVNEGNVGCIIVAEGNEMPLMPWFLGKVLSTTATISQRHGMSDSLAFAEQQNL